MAQNLNPYNAFPNANDSFVTGQQNNAFGELTSSLIFPTPFGFPHSFQQAWPSVPVWPQTGRENYAAANINNQAGAMGQNGVFQGQQDFVAFDDGDDFYGDDDGDVAMDPGGGQSRETSGAVHDHAIVEKGPLRNHIVQAANPVESPSQAQLPETKPSKPTTDKTNVVNYEIRANELKAKLQASLSSRRGPSTPSKKPDNTEMGSHGNGASKSSEIVQAPRSSPSKPMAQPNGHVPKTPTVAKNDDRFTVNPKAPPSQHSHINTDIEALFAEARNDHNVQLATRNRESPSLSKIPQQIKLANSHATDSQLGPKLQSLLAPTISRQPSQNGRSDTTEQGEIREEREEKEHRPKTGAADASLGATVSTAKSTVQEKPRHPASNHGPKTDMTKQQPQKIDTTLANSRRVVSGTNSARPRSPATAKSASSKLREFRRSPGPHDARDYRDPYSYRERVGADTWSPGDRRDEYDRGRAKDAYNREARKPENARSIWDDAFAEGARATTEHKRSPRDSIPENRDAGLEDRAAVIAQRETKVVTNLNVEEYFEDVKEWLEMTGYHDAKYRSKALERHRKLVQLDKERAALEREAQMEREEQSKLARVQSIQPREGAAEPTSYPTFNPSTYPFLSMLPPPTPTKDDLGIQIKDLASRREDGDNKAKPHIQNPTASTVSIKRQHPGDDLPASQDPPMHKIPRTDSKDASSDAKAQSAMTSGRLESRISVDDGSGRREYSLRRSRSPGYSRRASSPPSRRGSGQDFSTRQFARNGYSPGGRGYSRDSSPGDGQHDSPYDGPRARYDSHHHDADSRTGHGYPANQRGHHLQYQSPNYRSRGRGRGRGGFRGNA